MRVMFELDAPQMFQATDENRQRFRQWLRGVATDGGTNPRRSLAVGLDMTPSAIFMLSDGAFCRAREGE